MSSTPLEVGAERAGSGNSEFVLRAGISFVAVLICYLFQWHWLRAATLQGNFALDTILGVRLDRVASDAVLWNGSLYRYVISCTYADVWCGALAFLIDLRRSVFSNLSRLAIFTAVLFLFNVTRLSVSDFFFAHGVPWVLAHDVFAGFCYYAVWMYLWRTRSWK